MWGTGAGACTWGWDNTNVPPEVLHAFDGKLYVSRQYRLGGGGQATSVVYTDGSRVVGELYIRNRADGTFTMMITVYRGPDAQVVYFDCAHSYDGPIYLENRGSGYWDAPMVLPLPGSGTVPDNAIGPIETRGAMSALPSGKYLLRVDLTNRGAEANPTQVHLALDGYDVQGFPALPPDVECQPIGALMCTDEIPAGATVTMVILLSAGGDDSKTESIDLMVFNEGHAKVSMTLGGPLLNRPASIANRYRIVRP